MAARVMNKIIENDDDQGLDWRADADASLDRTDPERAAARPRGRPKGAVNRKTADFSDWYQAQGFKDPLVAQAQFLSADPVALQAFFIEHEKTSKAIGKAIGKAVPALIDIVKEQMACARDLAPYLHGKMPTKVEITDERLPMLVLNLGTNQLDQAKAIVHGRLSIGAPIADATSNDINGLALDAEPSDISEKVGKANS
ncbi:hypothetical protein SF83666_c19590 [Sinorhizobium fredii CCBAU 83666]|nr:hypothetical protein SF83666_c19590 [Sinorhizobium fredii CCBAU 83666]